MEEGGGGGWEEEDSGGDRAGTADDQSELRAEAAELLEEVVAQEDVIPFLITAIMAGTALLHCTTIPMFAMLQQTVVLFFLGMVYSLILELADLKERLHGLIGESYEMWMGIDPKLLLAVMLPVLISGDAMSIDTDVAKRVGKQCLYLAGPGVLINSFALAGFLKVYLPYDWSFLLCLTVASILAATDPVAVVSLLKELGASPTLTVQIQGESLLNDGTAIVLFTVAYSMLSGQEYTAGDIVIFLVKAAVCAVVLGIFIGIMAVLWIRKVANRLDRDRSSLIQISITLCCAYFSFISAEGTFEVSGVLCTVASSLVLADKMWPAIVSQEAMHHVWHMLEHCGNSVIFFVAGALTGNVLVGVKFVDYLHLLVIYVVCTLIRGAMIFGSRPILSALGHSTSEPVTWQDAALMTWGGLRGALGLALAIQVRIDRAEDKIDEHEGDRILFYVGGVALLTLLVNAMTCPKLVKWLQLNRPSGTKQMMMLNLRRKMKDVTEAKVKSSGSAGFIRENLDRMMGEVEDSVLQQVDKNLADTVDEQAQKLNRFTSPRSPMPKEGGRLARSSTHSNEENAASQDDSNEGVGCCGGGYSDVGSHLMKSGATLVRKLEDAREHFQDIPDEQAELLGLPETLPPECFAQQEQRILKLLREEKAVPKATQLKPVNDVFLSLVRAKYWAQMEADVWTKPEAETLLDTVSCALQDSGYHLSDFKVLRERLLRLHAKDDEATKATEHHPNSARTPQPVDMGCWRRLKSSRLYNILTGLVITFSTLFSMGVAVTTKPGHTDHFAVEGSVMTCLSVLFILDCLVKFYVLKILYWQNGWNKLDCFLTMLSLASLVLMSVQEILVAEDAPELIIAGTPVSQWIRVCTVMQVMRVHGIYTSIHNIRGLQRLRGSNRQLAGRVQAVTMLIGFIRSHVESQEELIKYFGVNGVVADPLVARCIVESLTEVFQASWTCWRTGDLVEANVKNALYTFRTLICHTKDLCHFVEEAHECGAVTEEDSESMLHPLKYQMKVFCRMIHDAQDGIKRWEKDFNNSNSYNTPAAYPALTASQELGHFRKAKDADMASFVQTESMMKSKDHGKARRPSIVSPAARHGEQTRFNPCFDLGSHVIDAAAQTELSAREIDSFLETSGKSSALQVWHAPEVSAEGLVDQPAGRSSARSKHVEDSDRWTVGSDDDLEPPTRPPAATGGSASARLRQSNLTAQFGTVV